MPRRGQLLAKSVRIRQRCLELLADGVERSTTEIARAMPRARERGNMHVHLLALHLDGKVQRRTSASGRSRWRITEGQGGAGTVTTTVVKRMGDAEVFVAAFEYLARQPLSSERDEFVRLLWEMAQRQDVCPRRLGSDETLTKLGLLRVDETGEREYGPAEKTTVVKGKGT